MARNTDPIFVYMTAGNLDEARRIASTLVAEKLAACANIVDGMESFYEWQDEVRNERETILIAKTRADLFKRLEERVLQLHSYECPCIVALQLSQGYAPFLRWIAAQTAAVTPDR